MMRLSFIQRALGARRLRDDESAISTVEFALILPIFITMGLTGVELAYMATVNMQVSQTAISLADNASRLGQTDNSSVSPTVNETDVDSIMAGALRQGESFNLEENGRLILSSLEYDETTGRQFIAWQRCRGELDRDSLYGNQNEKNGKGSFRVWGVGTGDTKITAPEGSAIMVAEIYYEYDGIIGGDFGDTAEFRQEAIFAIRDDRDLEKGVTEPPNGVEPQSLCS